MHTKYLGNQGELKVAAFFAEMGISVFKELGDISKKDLVIDYKDRLLGIQVKTISKKNGVYNFAAKKSGPNYQFRYTLNDCHFFALYCVEDKTIAWIKAEEATLSKKSFNLRADQAKNSQKKNVLWLCDYTDVMRVLRDYEQNT